MHAAFSSWLASLATQQTHESKKRSTRAIWVLIKLCSPKTRPVFPGFDWLWDTRISASSFCRVYGVFCDLSLGTVTTDVA